MAKRKSVDETTTFSKKAHQYQNTPQTAIQKRNQPQLQNHTKNAKGQNLTKTYFKKSEKEEEKQHQQYLLEVRGSDSAIWGDFDLVLLAGPLVDDGDSTLQVHRRRGSGGGGEAVGAEDRGGGGGVGGKQVSCEGGQTVACSLFGRRSCCF